MTCSHARKEMIRGGIGILAEYYMDLAYRDSKLYLYGIDYAIKIVDYSRDYPKQVIKDNPYWDHPFHLGWRHCELPTKIRIAIKKSGEVLIIISLLMVYKRLFTIFKMNLESKEYLSLGDDEMLIFGHGVTISAPVQDFGDGIKSSSICFVDDYIWPAFNFPSNCGIFDLATSKITYPKRFGVYIDQTQWFLPGSA